MRARVLSIGIAAALGLTLVAPSATATGSSASTKGSFIAHDFSWDSAGGGHIVTIAQGGTVTFSYPSGFSEHNADFTSGNPRSCVQTAGPNSGSVPPLPHEAAGAGWSGSCTFNTPGTYAFLCDVHPFMRGTVKVLASGTPPASSPLQGSPRQAVRVAKTQSGSTVRGTVKVGAAGAGGNLTATLLARASDLGRRGASEVMVGRTSFKLHAGTSAFSVPLSGSAKHALSHRGTLGLELKLAVRGRSGPTIRLTRSVTLRR